MAHSGVFQLRNVPHVHLHEKRESKTHWHGAEIQVIIEGNWTTHRVSNTFGTLERRDYYTVKLIK